MVDKFKSNKFAKKWQQELLTDDVIESANQVQSWNKYGVGMQVVSLWSIMIAFILGFVVCAIVVTPLVINSI